MSDRTPHPPYWFFHEYLDEERRMRIFKVTAETEQEARRLHRQACQFMWVTHHIDPSVSALYRRGERDMPIMQGGRPGGHYGAESKPITMPDYIRQLLTGFRMGDETALSGLRGADDGNAVLAAPSPPRTPKKQDSFDTPF
jgi:hypothetical protein